MNLKIGVGIDHNKKIKIIHFPAVANIIAGTIQMLVKSIRFYPYFSFCYIYHYCQSNNKIL